MTQTDDLIAEARKEATRLRVGYSFDHKTADPDVRLLSAALTAAHAALGAVYYSHADDALVAISSQLDGARMLIARLADALEATAKECDEYAEMVREEYTAGGKSVFGTRGPTPNAICGCHGPGKVAPCCVDCIDETLAVVSKARDEAIAEAAAMAEAIREAMERSGGRWCEWGGRAEAVRDILESAIEAQPTRAVQRVLAAVEVAEAADKWEAATTIAGVDEVVPLLRTALARFRELEGGE